jgi:hypothetical protein
LFLLFIGAGRLRFREFQRYIERIHELVDLNRFGEITEESGSGASRAIR